MSATELDLHTRLGVTPWRAVQMAAGPRCGSLVSFVVVGALAAISALDASQPLQVIGALAVLALGIVTERKILKGRKRDS